MSESPDPQTARDAVDKAIIGANHRDWYRHTAPVSVQVDAVLSALGIPPDATLPLRFYPLTPPVCEPDCAETEQPQRRPNERVVAVAQALALADGIDLDEAAPRVRTGYIRRARAEIAEETTDA